MPTFHLSRYLLPVAFVLLTSLAGAASDAGMQARPIHAMAQILLDLEHYPDANEKERLKAIADDSRHGDATRTIAMAIHDMQHRVTEKHRKALADIVSSEKASPEEQELAGILLGITHYPDENAKARLRELMK